MIDKLIVDGNNIQLTEKDKFPYNYKFSTAKSHNVKYALSDTNEISAGAFANCTYMTSVKFPKEITMIKRRAFENCSRLNNITIPKTIQYIGANVWDGCTGMTEIHFEHTGHESDPIPSNFAEMPSNCKVYIPDDSKYVLVDKDASGNNIMNPDSVDYYTKTKYNMYQYVAPQMLNDTDEYYYDAWTGIAPNDKTIEEKNRIPIVGCDFETANITTSLGNTIILNYTIIPSNATNRKLYFYSSNENIVKIKDDEVEGELMLKCDDTHDGQSEITVYAESGASSKCVIKVKK